MDWHDIEKNIAQSTGKAFHLDTHSHIGGGDINTAMKISGSGREYFLKLNRASLLDMFEAEADGLRDLASANALRVPQAICTGTVGSQAYIVLEYLPMGGSGRGVMARFGEQLAKMHHHSSERFGWHRDNTIGSTRQVNNWENDWLTFWREQRLGFQLQLAQRHGLNTRIIAQGEKLQQHVAAFFQGYQPQASILHGDLWSGNYGITDSGEPVIFDPATYYGDREADLAMTELFGGFGGEFYAAYNSGWPLDAGYAVRKTFYNLYHILNHFNLFGGGYGAQAGSMIDRLLAEAR
jgi:fructosamine-3-kinase